MFDHHPRRGSNMQKGSLQLLLDQGVSVERIAKRFGKDPSTVSYWMKKYGLESPYKEKHAAKGGIEKERLEALVERGMSIAQIAAEVDRSMGTVRHWLRVHGLRTKGADAYSHAGGRRTARAAGKLSIKQYCPTHGETDFILEGRGFYRCKRCRSDSVVRHRKRMKQILVEEAGGRCVVCGYSRSARALQFHHVDPSTKRLGLSAQGVTYSLEVLRNEARKCILLCANCHAEVEDGRLDISLQLAA
jgi:transposase